METDQKTISSDILTDSSDLMNGSGSTLIFADMQISLSNESILDYGGQQFRQIDMSFMSSLKEFGGVILPKFSWHHFGGQSMEDIRDKNYKRFQFGMDCSFDTYLTTSHPIQSGNPFVMHFRQHWILSSNPKFDQIKRTLKDEYRYTSLFIGNIPLEIQELCRSLQQEDYFANFYLICEALNWESQEIATIDPLVVMHLDRTNVDAPAFYLVAKFDCTPDEKYVVKEFVI